MGEGERGRRKGVVEKGSERAESERDMKTYSVVDIDARVNNVRAGALASGLVVDVRRGARGAVRDACQAPWNIGLRDIVARRHDGVLLNVVDLRSRVSVHVMSSEIKWLYLGQLADRIQHLRVQLGREALEVAGAVDMLGRGRLELLDGVEQRVLGRAVLELDDVVARDELDTPRLDDGRREGEGEEGGPGEELHGGFGCSGGGSGSGMCL